MKNIGLFAFLFKVSPIALKFLKSLKILKVALLGGSMLAYSYLFTWEFAVILLAAIIFHEYGHITGMKKCAMKTKGIYLIPFFGGAAVPDEQFKNRRDETFVALYGPFYGFLLLLPFLFYGIIFESPLAVGLASFMALINLFNLLPINPLDGGRVVKSIAFSLNTKFGLFTMVLGILLALAAVYFFKIWLLIFIIIIGGLELFFEWTAFKKSQNLVKAELERQTQLHNENIQSNDIDYTDTNTDTYNSDTNNKQVDINEVLNSSIYSDLMTKSQIKRYSFIYILLSLAFIGVIFLTANYPGADLALKLIMDSQ
jgi:Zn-dependent protease